MEELEKELRNREATTPEVKSPADTAGTQACADTTEVLTPVKEESVGSNSLAVEMLAMMEGQLGRLSDIVKQRDAEVSRGPIINKASLPSSCLDMMSNMPETTLFFRFRL